jgi:hypothetical protein
MSKPIPTLAKAAPGVGEHYWVVDTLSGGHQFHVDEPRESESERVIRSDDQKLTMSYPMLTAQDSRLVVSPTAQFFTTASDVGRKELSADQLEGFTQHIQSWWEEQLMSVAGRVKIMKWMETGNVHDLASEAKESADMWAGQYTWQDVLYNPSAGTAQPLELSLEDYVQPTLDEVVSHLRPASDDVGEGSKQVIAAAKNELLDRFGAYCPSGSTIPSWRCTLETAMEQMALKLKRSVNTYDQMYNQNRYWSDTPREISIPDVLTEFKFARDVGGVLGDPGCYIEESDPANATHLKVYASTLPLADESGESKPLTPLKTTHCVNIRQPRSYEDDASENSST